MRLCRAPAALLVVLAPLVACSARPLAEGSSSADGESSSESEASTGTEPTSSNPSGELPTGTTGDEAETSDGTEGGEDPPDGWPELVADNCELDILWTWETVDDDEDRLHELGLLGPGRFVLGGLDVIEGGDHGTMLMGIVDGETAWTVVEEPMFFSDYEDPVVEIAALDAETFLAFTYTEANAFSQIYSSAGELIDYDVQYGARWADVVGVPGGFAAVGLSVLDMLLETTIARFDEFGVMLDSAYAPTVGIVEADVDWASSIYVEGDRTWVAGWDQDRCGVVIEYDAEGVEQWWECAVLGEDGEGRLGALEPLANGNLAISGSARITKNGFWYHEPWIAALTREGQPVWEWRPGFAATYGGRINNLAVTESGDIIAAYGETDYDQGGLDADTYPVLMRRDQDGEFVERCAFERPGIAPEWDTEIVDLELGPGDAIFILLEERIRFGAYRYAIVEVSGLG